MELTNDLRQRISEFRQTPTFKNGGKISIYMMAAIEIACNLVDLGVYNKRPITKDEEHWFNGSYQLDFESLPGKHSEIRKLYSELVRYCDENNFFRNEI